MTKLTFAAFLIIMSTYALAGQKCIIADVKSVDQVDSKVELTFEKPEIVELYNINFSYDGSLSDFIKQLEVRKLSSVCDSFIFTPKHFLDRNH